MDDAALVRGGKCVGDLTCDGQRLVARNRTVCDPVGQRRPIDELEDERGGPA